jgi:iron complex outermembrane receptor protein
VALSRDLVDGVTAYGSYGEGVETNVTPNKPSTYLNAGQPLPALTSKQYELGLKGQQARSRWQIALFDISRPQAGDACDTNGANCTRQIDGQARHRGLELSGGLHQGAWTLQGSGAWIDAQRQQATIDPSVNGQRPVNVPKYTLRALAQYRWADVPGLRTSLRLSHEGQRRVLEDGSINLPAWTTLDFAAHYDTRMGGIRTEWTFAIDNLTDQRYWRESPKQFGHYYLYPGAPRTGRITVRTSF